ncbi:MAG: TlyA family RNA methyltransferase [Actinomycetota bacterium]|nr:TlyA family RNA methyltransferase [Actinomycetota bacterium]
MTRRRLDAELVRRKMAPSREAAQRLIADGTVLVGGTVADKAARQVAAGEAIRLLGPRPRYVSRAGLKLEAALDRFAIDPRGRRCLDAGSSTGGFTDCLLQRGAAMVTAVDVGTHQLHERLRGDDRVSVREQTDVRRLSLGPDEPAFELVVGDLSFISLRLVLPALASLAAPGATMALLIKPQFEAGRQEASRGKGVISDPAIWRRVIHEVEGAARTCGAAMLGLMPSPITGSSGNVEFIGHFAREGDCHVPAVRGSEATGGPVDHIVDIMVERAIEEAGLLCPPRHPSGGPTAGGTA